MVIDFREIESAKGGNQGQDKWELFARDFYEVLGMVIVSGPGRGPDDGRDLLVKEISQGVLRTHEFLWLVSCKHYAHSNSSIGENDEFNITDRIRKFKAGGFIGFYSSLPSAALQRTFDRMRSDFQIEIYDSARIESVLTGNERFKDIFSRYFPESYRRWKKGTASGAVPKFEDYAKQYLNEKMNNSNIRKSTKVSFENQVRKHLLPGFGEFSLDRINNVEWLQWVGKTKTIAKFFNTRKALVEILTAAWEEGQIERVPKFDSPDVAQDVGRVLEDEEVLRVLKKSSRPFRFIFFCFWILGCPPREIMKWEWSMISWNGPDDTWVSIPVHISRSKKERKIRMPPEVFRVLLRRHQIGNNSKFAFPSRIDLHKPQNSYQSAWVTACREAGVEDAMVTDFRRTYISRAADRGDVPYDIAEHLGVDPKQIEKDYKQALARKRAEKVTGAVV